MSNALQEFLALRQASALDIQNWCDLAGDPQTGSEQVTAFPNGFQNSTETHQTETGEHFPHTNINDQELDTYFVELLAAHPDAKHVNDPQVLANYLARGIRYRYGNPKNITWEGQIPFHGGAPERSLWVARCPAGHVTEEVIESREVLGWACKDCRRVYGATECRMVPRGVLETDRRAQASQNEGSR